MKVNKRVTNVSYLGNNEIHIKHKSTQSVCNSSPNSHLFIMIESYTQYMEVSMWLRRHL